LAKAIFSINFILTALNVEALIMAINDLWYLFVFAWGIVSAWAVISGLQG
jgi:hypothetical protein